MDDECEYCRRSMTRRQGSRRDAVRRLRRSPHVVDAIPARLRLLDLVLVLLVLPFALVAGSLIALAVFLDSPGQVFYRSRRIGRGGRPFEMLKFRTMVRDAAGPPISTENDERFTPLGRTLASSRLDELPQLWNVLRGDMRLVGPRPELEEFVREFPAEYERVLSVPPGLTGPAQVEYAWEGETLATARAVDRARVYRETVLPYKLAIDLAYAQRHTVRGDLWLLLRTIVLPAVRAARLLGVGGSTGKLPTTRLAYGIALGIGLLTLVGLLATEALAPV
jgi:lipopolysaccharide/colanic/teichoic acid biosynthesis glycosyltransferase